MEWIPVVFTIAFFWTISSLFENLVFSRIYVGGLKQESRLHRLLVFVSLLGGIAFGCYIFYRFAEYWYRDFSLKWTAVLLLLWLACMLYILFVLTANIFRFTKIAVQKRFSAWTPWNHLARYTSHNYALTLILFISHFIGNFVCVIPPEFQKDTDTISIEKHLCFNSKILFMVMRPLRGSIVIITTEEFAGLEGSWQDNVPAQFHFHQQKSDKSNSRIRRVIGMPGESMEVKKGVVFVNGQKLQEPYVKAYATLNQKIAFNLAEDTYLVARDLRTEEALLANDSFLIVHSRQISSRQFFIFWPLKMFGFVRTPQYNIPNPPVFTIQLDEGLIQKLVRM